MKRTIVLCMVCLFMPITSLFAATWDVKVDSDKDAYSPGEKVVFKIKIKKNKKWVSDKQIIINATFPYNNTPVSMEELLIGRYRFTAKIADLPEKQTLHVSIFQKTDKGKFLVESEKTITVVAEYNNSFSIKEGGYTANNEITILIDSNKNYELFISEDPLFTDCSSVPYSQQILYLLSNGDGKKTIYLKFLNKLNKQEQVENRQITLDTAYPQLTIISPSAGSTVSGRKN